MEQFFSIVRKNALKMRRMRKLVNYADPHHRILSDALLLERGRLLHSGVYPNFNSVEGGRYYM